MFQTSSIVPSVIMHALFRALLDVHPRMRLLSQVLQIECVYRKEFLSERDLDSHVSK